MIQRSFDIHNHNLVIQIWLICYRSDLWQLLFEYINLKEIYNLAVCFNWAEFSVIVSLSKNARVVTHLSVSLFCIIYEWPLNRAKC